MLLKSIFCSNLSFTQWLQDHLLSCPFKKLTGFDCPGCGFQRSFISLMQGNLSQSVHYYPATIPLLITAMYAIADKHLHFNNKNYIRDSLYICTGMIITGSYLVKLCNYMQMTTYHF